MTAQDELELAEKAVQDANKGKVLFESLTQEDQTKIIQEVNEEIRKMNVLMSQELSILRHTLVTLRPVIKTDHKGRIKCLVCQVENKQREFKHLERCVWKQLHDIMGQNEKY